MTASAAFDSASDPAYAGRWTAGSNGGTGFGPWDFTRSSYGPLLGPAAWGGLTHFIDNAPLPANNLGKPAFTISVDDCSFCGVYQSASRPFASSLSVGQTFSMDFDNPLLASPDFNTQNNIISFYDSAGVETFGLFGSNYFSSQQWNFGIAGGSTLITDAATASGSSISLKKTGANTADLVFNGVSFPNVTLGGTGELAGVAVIFGGTVASAGDGSREFFVNNLSIVPEPNSFALMFVAGCACMAGARRGK